jgi:hypothetical protein
MPQRLFSKLLALSCEIAVKVNQKLDTAVLQEIVDAHITCYDNVSECADIDDSVMMAQQCHQSTDAAQPAAGHVSFVFELNHDMCMHARDHYPEPRMITQQKFWRDLVPIF